MDAMGPGASQALIYFVLLNIFVAIVLDTFSLASRLYAVEADKKNPMIAAWRQKLLFEMTFCCFEMKLKLHVFLNVQTQNG